MVRAGIFKAQVRAKSVHHPTSTFSGSMQGATLQLNWCFFAMPRISKRKVHATVLMILLVILAGILIGTLFRPAPSDVRVTFLGYTNSPSQFFGASPMFTNASFWISNASPSVTTRVSFHYYEITNGNKVTSLSPPPPGILCVLRPRQSTNLVFLFLPQVDDRWRLCLSSSRHQWIMKLSQQPAWLQNIAIKVIPRTWMAEFYNPDIVSDWVTNGESGKR
jgi:hypothetical protein